MNLRKFHTGEILCTFVYPSNSLPNRTFDYGKYFNDPSVEP